jgi:two-component system, LytTR family, response regulator
MMTQQPSITSSLRLPFSSHRRWIDLAHIVRLEGEGNYTTCVFSDGSYLMVAVTLKRLANRLPDGQFVRLHRKHLVNRQFVKALGPGKTSLHLTNGDHVAISRRRVGTVVQELGQPF